MSLGRLHAPELAPGKRVVGGEDFHYLRHVLRARRGDSVVLFDGAGGEADASVTSVGERSLELEVGAPRAAATQALRLTLLVGVLKGERMDLVVQKTTELGVARIVPLAATNAVVRLHGERAATRADRWRRIAREAARQSRRADVPEIAEVASLAEAIAGAGGGLRLLFHEKAEAPLRPLLAAPPRQVVAAVGPEGGFTPDEVEVARAAGFAIVSLGPRILRAETAAIAAVTIVGFTAEEML